ncbi:11480_t:CDS:2 [Ambispora gerdemannii]|uniref:11480_t:CDS:1 n=1 Tax=Ambispora gerdemannii TaxID=144530 RepID=A0A9N9CSY7_9GLOM|nr:11480_t:CDS:2 [Ambispora gerdemannii]
MSRNAKFDIKLTSKRWYTDPMQASDYSVITGTTTAEFDTNEEMNLVISIHKHDTYRASIHTKNERHPRLTKSTQQGVLRDLHTRRDLNARQDLNAMRDKS